jgi:hypothetical protein
MEVDVKTVPNFSASKPRLLFETSLVDFDVAPDGRFLLLRDVEKPKPFTEIVVAQGVLPRAKRLFW